MARCRCISGTCTCLVQAGPGITISGNGDTDSPMVISTTPVGQLIVADDTPEVNLTAGGTGTVAAPLHLSADLPWLASIGGATGDVMTKQPTGFWAPGPPSQVPIGSVVTGFGITGDGTVGTPLRVDICSYDQLKAACAP